MDRAIEGLLKLASGIRWRRLIVILAVLVSLYFLGQAAEKWVVASFDFNQQIVAQKMIRRAVITAMVLYIVLMAIPFMPGVEVGLSMLMLLGGKVALLVYLCTIAALMLSFLAGRFIPVRLAARAFHLFGLARAEELLQKIAALPVSERPAFLLDNVPPGLTPLILRHRYVALAILINLPGNMLIGGGGGIALAAGMTRLFTWPAFLLTIALAVAPVPLLIYFVRY
jgi:hypothetical protein